jgi:DNA-binding NarL/FixJ family response regulator
MRNRNYTTRAVPCVICGEPREIRGDCESAFAKAARQACLPCNAQRASQHVDYTRDWAVDWVVIERLVAGTPVQSNPAERRAAVARLVRQGLSEQQIAERLHVAQRTVARLRKSLRDKAAA